LNVKPRSREVKNYVCEIGDKSSGITVRFTITAKSAAHARHNLLMVIDDLPEAVRKLDRNELMTLIAAEMKARGAAK
jgi:hypothetical protein